MVEKKGLKKGQGTVKLTKTQQEIIHLLTVEYMTIKQIALSRNKSLNAIYKTINILKKKGVINKDYKKVENIGCTNIQPKNTIRLHAQEFNIQILYKDHRYKKIREKANTIFIDNNTIRLYENAIEVYAAQDRSFISESPQKATYDSMQYWTRFFYRLENDLKIIIMKNRYQNIKLVKSHYAETKNEIAKDYEVRGDKLKIYANEDGKLAILIDNSFNLNELEFVHTNTAKQDAENVLSHIKDLREHNPPKLSEIAKVLKETDDLVKENAAGLNSIISLIKAQFPQETKVLQKQERVNYIG